MAPSGLKWPKNDSKWLKIAQKWHFWNVAIYAFCQAQIFCWQAPKTILHPWSQDPRNSPGTQCWISKHLNITQSCAPSSPSLWPSSQPLPARARTGIRQCRCNIDSKYNISKVLTFNKVSGTTTEFCIPDHWVQAAVMVKIRTFKLNPDLFRTTFWTFPDL